MKQLVSPYLEPAVGTGLCLTAVQQVFGAPSYVSTPGDVPSAWDSWMVAKHRHGPDTPLPNVPVPVYFEHWGTYGPMGYRPYGYGNWGHIVAWIPGRGYLSSPASGFGRQWFSTIAEIERTFNARYVGWAEDVNGKRVAEPDTPRLTEEIDMLTFIASSPKSPWYVTDGITKRPLAPGENQLLVDLGQARYPAKPGKVHLVSPVQLARIPDEKSALPLDTKGIVEQVLAGIRATGVKVDVDADKVADAVLDVAAKRLQS